MNIVQSDPRRKYIVVSAPGKAHPSDNKVTDMLYALLDSQHHLREKHRRSRILEMIASRYNSLAQELGVSVPEIEEVMSYLDGSGLTLYDAPNVVTRGEYLMAKIVAKTMACAFVDARGLLMFGDQHFKDPLTYNLQSSREKAAKIFCDGERCIIPGFYGTRESNGMIYLFSRGGSDLTGAYIAELVDAEVYENWTDVSGLRMTDPRVVEDPAHVPVLSYAEARELTYMGANVLHDAVSVPLVRAQIPLVVRNTNEPDGAVTHILPSVPEEQRRGVVTGIAGKKDFTVITAHKLLVNDQVGFLRDVAAVFAEKGVSIDHSVTLIDGVSIAVRTETLTDDLRSQILDGLRRACAPDSIDVEDNISLICTVGHGMRRKTGVSAKLYTALANAGVNAGLQLQAGGELTIIVGVANADYEKAIRSIYNAFVPGSA